MPITLKLRVAVIAEFADKLSGKLGRTAIMKPMFFLQELKGLPLGYSFRIYTYGPYDAQVLADLKVAESMEAVRTEYFDWEGGSGYMIKAGKKRCQKRIRSFFLRSEMKSNGLRRSLANCPRQTLRLKARCFLLLSLLNAKSKNRHQKPLPVQFALSNPIIQKDVF